MTQYLEKLSELLKAQESCEIKPRTELKEIFDKFTNEGIDKISVVTTNWDEVLDKAINQIFQWGRSGNTRPVECYHLHGSIRNPGMMYLPSEITMETYRSKNEENIFGIYHGNFMNLLQTSHKTILYGISLDPLDAELNVSLASSWISKNNKEIIIINPNHKLVAERVRLLLDSKSSVKILGYDPGELNNKVEYR